MNQQGTLSAQSQPKGFFVLFFCEVWDRFSFYGLQSILVLFLTNYYGLADKQAYGVYGIYMSLAFITPVIGGFVADKLLGFKRAIISGLVLLILGNACFVFHSTQILLLGLGTITVGIGLFKANNASLLGILYESQDSRREKGFTIFYMGMNLGAILGAVSYGFLTQTFGWHAGFVASAIGCAISLILFLLRQTSIIPIIKTIDVKNGQASKSQLLIKNMLMVLAIIMSIFFVVSMFSYHIIFDIIIWGISGTTVFYIFKMSLKYGSKERHNIIVLFLLIVFGIFYFASLVQVGSSLMLFIDRNIHFSIAVIKIPTQVYAALEPLFVVLATPFVTMLLGRTTGRNYLAIVLMRVLLSIVLAGVSFWVFSWAASNVSSHDLQRAVIWIIIGNLLLGLGEISIGPAITSAVTYLAPNELRGTFMGIWFLSIGFAGYIGSLFAEVKTTDTISYAALFKEFAIIIFVISIIFVFLYPMFRRFVLKNEITQ